MALSEEEFGSLLSLLSRLEDPSQMTRLNTAIVSKREQIQRMQVHRVRSGMKVSWTGKAGRQTGEVIRVKQKYVEVRVPTGVVWNVAASLLEIEK